MAIRKTIDDLVDALLQAGVPKAKVKRALEMLGLSSDGIQEVLAVARDSPVEEDQALLIQEELEKQKFAIEALREEVSRLNAALSKLCKALAPGDLASLETRISSLEADVKGIVEALGEYALQILRKPRTSGA